MLKLYKIDFTVVATDLESGTENAMVDERTVLAGDDAMLAVQEVMNDVCPDGPDSNLRVIINQVVVVDDCQIASVKALVDAGVAEAFSSYMSALELHEDAPELPAGVVVLDEIPELE